HFLEVGSDGLSNRRPPPVPVSLNGFDARAVSFEFEGFPTCAVQDFRAIFDLLALSSVLPPFDVVVSLRMKLNLAAHANLIAEFTVRLHDGGIEVPVRADFVFFEDVYAIVASVAVAAFGHRGVAFRR